MIDVFIGITDRTVPIFIPDPASTTGAGKAGLAAAAITVVYSRYETDNDVVATDVTSSVNDLSALTDAHNDWGWKEVHATLAKGQYRLDIADAVFASGAWYAVVQVTITSGTAAATPMAFRLIARNDLTDIAQTGDAYAVANTRLPAALTANGNMKSSLVEILTTALTETAGLLAAGFKKFFNVATPVSTMDVLARVTLTDTATTLTGHTPQTGDTYARIGANGVSLSAIPDLAGVTTLLSRLSGARAGYLDNLNVGGNVASSAEATAIQNNTRVVRVVPEVIERPDSGTATYRIELLLYDDVGNMEAPDSAPTIALVNQAGTDRSSRLDSATMALVSTGRYRAIYTADVGDALEQLVWTFSVVEGGNTRLYGNQSVIVDTTAVDFTAADRVKLDALHGKLPSRAYFAGVDASTGALLATDIRTALGMASANLDTQLDALPTNSELATALAAADDAVLVAIAALNNLSQANVRTALGLASANLDTQLDALPTTSEVLTQVQTANRTAVLDSVPALTDRPSLEQAAYLITQYLYNRAVVGTTETVKKPDGSTTLATLTLNDATSPTAVARAS